MTPIGKRLSMQRGSKEEAVYKKKDFYNDKLSVKGRHYGCMKDLEWRDPKDLG